MNIVGQCLCLNEPHGSSSYEATMFKCNRKMLWLLPYICACDLVNIWDLATGLMMKSSTLFDCGPLSPDIICVISVPRPSPFFTALLLPCITEEQKWGRPGNKPSPALKVLYTYTCSWQGDVVHDYTCVHVNVLAACSTVAFSHQTPCHQNLIAPGLSSNVRSYALSVNRQTVEQKYICTNDSELCSYAWNVVDHSAVNYMVSVAANNVVGQSVTKNCTTTPISKE